MGTWIEIVSHRLFWRIFADVVPYVGTWIEISVHEPHWMHGMVVPYVGTWIEM